MEIPNQLLKTVSINNGELLIYRNSLNHDILFQFNGNNTKIESIGSLFQMYGKYGHKMAETSYSISSSHATKVEVEEETISYEDSNMLMMDRAILISWNSSSLLKINLITSRFINVDSLEISDAIEFITISFLFPIRSRNIPSQDFPSELILSASVKLHSHCSSVISVDHIVLTRFNTRFILSKLENISSKLIHLDLKDVKTENSSSSSSSSSYDEVNEDDDSKGMFVNGWNAWSFCGAVLKSQQIPLPTLPDVFTRSFHDGSASFSINTNKRWRPGYLLNVCVDTISNLLGYKNSSFGPLDPKYDYLASDMFTILYQSLHTMNIYDVSSYKGIIAGFLSQHAQFGCLSTNINYNTLSIHISCDGAILSSRVNRSISIDPLLLYIPFQGHLEDDPLGRYYHLSGRYNRYIIFGSEIPKINGNWIPAGWCSWYQYFENITEPILKTNLEKFQEIRSQGLDHNLQGFSLVQIDDGYQRAWGDWLSPNLHKFPSNSLPQLANITKSKGLKPGLWLAPFAVDKHSEIARIHPEWILRLPGGSPANSAFCGKWFLGLDVTNEKVQAQIEKVVQGAVSWGFSYLKLDFLYAGALNASNSFADRSATRAEALQRGLNAVHRGCTTDGHTDVFVLGCGAPLGSVIGHVHANRVSSGTFAPSQWVLN
jgi:hypothetical protein